MNNYKNLIVDEHNNINKPDNNHDPTPKPIQPDANPQVGIETRLESLPVLLPFELDQLLNDNDALVDLIHELLMANRGLDALPYMNHLNQNLSVLSYHYEVYSRSFSNSIELFVNNGDKVQNENQTMMAMTTTTTTTAHRQVKTSTQRDMTGCTQPNYIAVSVATLNYMEKQFERAVELKALFDIHIGGDNIKNTLNGISTHGTKHGKGPTGG